jgi:tripartite-type tricarboxylate transporter receptor subunit TctC
MKRCGRISVGAAILALGLGFSLHVAAQAWPSKPVRLIIPYAAGGVFDSLFRPIAHHLTQSLGQPFIIENKPGASTAIGTATCAQGEPDGYTFCITGTSVILNEFLQSKIKYDWVKDLAPVTNLVFLDGPIVANASMPFNNLNELVDYAKKNPGKLNFGSFGEGSTAHLYLEWVKNKAGLDIAHVSYKGAAQVNQALLANEVQLTFMATGTILPFIKAGKVKALAMPAPVRSRYLPDVPTMYESGYDFKPTSWVGVFAAARTPTPIIERMQRELNKLVNDPEFRKTVIEPQFYDSVANTPAEFAEFLKTERKFVGELVRISGVKPVN